MKIKARDGRYWLHGTVAGKFLRLPLGTANKAAASQTAEHVERAIAQGQASLRWIELRKILPLRTFAVLAEIGNYREAKAEIVATWADLEAAFRTKMKQRRLLGKLAESTAIRYEQSLRVFDAFLKVSDVSELPSINRAFVERFKVWRLAEIQKKKFARGGRGLALDVAILHRVFAIGVECELVQKNPVAFEGRPGDSPEHGAQPFRGEQLTKLRRAAGDDLLAFLLLRWTGLRGSDAVRITWDEIEFDAREINRLTLKRKKRVVVPIHTELLFALQAEFNRRKPQPDERVLINPGPWAKSKPLTRPRLYYRMVALGKRAGVPDAHPHRFRDTFAVDMLSRGASAYEVAKLLGDTVDTIERHYAPFVKELRERTRRIMENTEGIERPDCTFITQCPADEAIKPANTLKPN
jgi:integrase